MRQAIRCSSSLYRIEAKKWCLTVHSAVSTQMLGPSPGLLSCSHPVAYTKACRQLAESLRMMQADGLPANRSFSRWGCSLCQSSVVCFLYWETRATLCTVGCRTLCDAAAAACVQFPS